MTSEPPGNRREQALQPGRSQPERERRAWVTAVAGIWQPCSVVSSITGSVDLGALGRNDSARCNRDGLDRIADGNHDADVSVWELPLADMAQSVEKLRNWHHHAVFRTDPALNRIEVSAGGHQIRCPLR